MPVSSLMDLRRGMAACLGAALLLQLGCSSVPDRDEGAPAPAIVPAGLAFPYVKRPACPGEGCTYGTWLACDTVQVYGAEGDTTAVAYLLAASDSFEVHAGAVYVRAPGAVVVSRPVYQIGFDSSGVLFQPGDTLFVLDYLGEGFFDAWYRDTVLETEVFWPWEHWFPSPDYVYGGRVVQEGETEFWIEITSRPGKGKHGWVVVDWARLAMPNSFDPVPLECVS